ncbi:MAG: hypothetical protein ABMA25_17945, partial [Ilumatobacteraceae bacterium]
TEGLAPASGGALQRLILPTTDGQGPNQPVIEPSFSANGQFIAFISAATNLVPGETDARPDVFVLHRTTNSIEKIPTGTTASASLAHARLSNDGNLVFFSTNDATALPSPGSIADNVFIYNRTAHATQLVSTDVNGNTSPYGAGLAAMSGDGNVLAFISWGPFTPDDTDQKPDLYLRNVAAGTIVRLSEPSAFRTGFRVAVSDDGTHVWFNEYSGAHALVHYDVEANTFSTFGGFATLVVSPSSGGAVIGSTYNSGIRTFGPINALTGLVVPVGPAPDLAIGPWVTNRDASIMLGFGPADGQRNVDAKVTTWFAVTTSTGEYVDIMRSYNGALPARVPYNVSLAAEAGLIVLQGPPGLLPGPYDPTGLYLYDLSTV